MSVVTFDQMAVRQIPRAARQDQHKRIPIDKIIVGERQRSFDREKAEAFAATLPELGLIHSIEVYAHGDSFKLIAGFHRLEACKMAGWTDVPAKIVTLDDQHLDASAALREAMENLMRNELVALDRMAHLHAAKVAHDEMFPAAKGGRPRKMTRAAEETLPFFGRFSFSREAAERIGMARSVVNMLTTGWERLSPNSRMRLRGSRLQDKQGELLAIAELEHVGQKIVLDLLLADAPEVSTVAEAVARVKGEEAPDPDERRVTRFAVTIGKMPVEQRDRIFEANEEAVRDFARRRGWLA